MLSRRLLTLIGRLIPKKRDSHVQVHRSIAYSVRREWGYRLPRALAIYLRVYGPVPKTRIFLDFWPDSSSQQAGRALTSAICQARRIVGQDSILVEEDACRWNPVVPCSCDVDEFEDLRKRALVFPPGDPRAIAPLKQAVSLYRGPFLDGFPWEWRLELEERLAEEYLDALLLLGELHLLQQEYQQAGEYYRQALRVNAGTEEAYRGRMLCYARCDDRGRAAQVYRQCCEYLRQELGVEPSEETKALYRAIAEGNAPLPSSPRRRGNGGRRRSF